MSSSKFIFIVGHIPSTINFSTIQRFKAAQNHLETLGYKVYNPVNQILESKDGFYLAATRNLIDLIQCGTVYVLNDDIALLRLCLDLAIAFRLNHTILHQQLFVELQNENGTCIPEDLIDLLNE